MTRLSLSLADLKTPLPQYYAPPMSIVQKIRMLETSQFFYWDLIYILDSVHRTITQAQLRPLADALMPAVLLGTRLHLTADGLADACRCVREGSGLRFCLFMEVLAQILGQVRAKVLCEGFRRGFGESQWHFSRL